jgi:hypothetical protein
LHLTATPQIPPEQKLQGLIVPSSSILKWNHQIPELPEALSIGYHQTNSKILSLRKFFIYILDSHLQNHERVYQNILPKKEHPQIVSRNTPP